MDSFVMHITVIGLAEALEIRLGQAIGSALFVPESRSSPSIWSQNLPTVISQTFHSPIHSISRNSFFFIFDMGLIRTIFIASLAVLGSNAASAVIDLIPSNFDDVVLKSGKPALVEFFAPWCGRKYLASFFFLKSEAGPFFRKRLRWLQLSFIATHLLIVP